MLPALTKALEGKTDSELLDIILLALIDNEDSLLNKLSEQKQQTINSYTGSTDTANTEIIKSVVHNIRNRAMVQTKEAVGE